MSQQEMIDAFVTECGSLEDWQGDKKEWHTAAGFFFHGWMACEKSGPTKRAADVCHVAAQRSSNQNQRLVLVAHAANANR